MYKTLLTIIISLELGCSFYFVLTLSVEVEKLVTFRLNLACSYVLFDLYRVKVFCFCFFDLVVVMYKLGTFMWKPRFGASLYNQKLWHSGNAGWLAFPYGGSWLELAEADNSACLHEAWPLHFTTTALHLLRFTRIWSAWLLFPFEFQAPAHLGWIDFQISCVSVLNLATSIRNSTLVLEWNRHDFSHSRKSRGGQSRAGVVAGKCPASPLSLLASCSAIWSLWLILMVARWLVVPRGSELHSR